MQKFYSSNYKRFCFVFILTSSFLCLFSIAANAQQNQWTWMKGDSATNSTGTFGTQGLSNINNTPPGLYEAMQWTDKHGNFWLFGGVSSYHEFNTLWKFEPSSNEWTWMKGSSIIDASGIYGTQGMPSASNTPGARAWGGWTWVDTAGNLWLYGGLGYDASGIENALSDLWKYDVTTNEWTWMDGPSSGTVAVVYGTKGTAAPGNSPGARAECDAAWVDDSDRLWLFGGALYVPQTSGWAISGYGNDMWMWNPNNDEWTWLQGTNALNGSGVYGTKGVADSSNHPTGRGAYCNWKDSAENFYLFAGYNLSYCWNDLWKYDWQMNVFTWVSGTELQGGFGTYGVPGVPDTNNIPAARYENRCFWQDGCGNFWLWGGLKNVYPNTPIYNDLWRYKPSTREWTWVSGDSAGNFTGNYGAMGISSPANQPPAKFGAPGWIDTTGNLWMFGGNMPGGFSFSQKNDLWRYVPDSAICFSPLPPSQSNFAAMDTAICEKFCIDFIDSSLNNPVAWQWNFPGGNPASSMEQNPTNICYQNPGIFDVTLITTNANGIPDTLTLSNYITVYTNPFAPVISQNGNILTSTLATSYQWQLNLVDIPGATNQSYTITQSGLYTVVIGDNNGCNSQSSIDASYVGISNVAGSFSVTIFPNPSNGIFSVDVSVTNEIEIDFEVLNTLGQTLSEKTEHASTSHFTTAINLQKFSSGIYFLKVKAGEAIMQFKLVNVE